MDSLNNITFGLAFVSGFLSFISPCVLPMIPAYVSYLGGRATMQVAAAGAGGGTVTAMRVNRLEAFVNGLLFVAGFTLVFVVFGMLTNTGIQALRGNSYDIQVLITRIGGVVIIFFGLHVLGVTGWLLRTLDTRVDWEKAGNAGMIIQRGIQRITGILYSDTRRQMNPHGGHGYFGSALLGIVFAAGWTPCIGPIYGSILTMSYTAVQDQTLGQVATLLLAYSLGLGMPFLIAALALEQVKGLLRRIQRYARVIEVVSGVFLIVIGVLLVTDRFSYLNQWASGLGDFSINLDECATGVMRGQIESGSLIPCIQNGADSIEKKEQSGAYLPTTTDPLLTLSDGRVVRIRF